MFEKQKQDQNTILYPRQDQDTIVYPDNKFKFVTKLNGNDYIYIFNIIFNQRKLGSNTSELRMTFTWCNWLWWRVVDHRTIHYLAIHNKRIIDAIDYDEGW